MKKLSTLVCFMLAGGFAFAQQAKTVGPANPANVNIKQSAIQEKRGVELNPTAGNRAIIWSDDFSTPSNWTMSNTSNPPLDWVIGTALPASLTSQGFDGTINSVSGGNFAYIDSDGAGGTATQDAYITTAADIDLSAVSSVELTFTNYHRRYLETHYVSVSVDGGATWTDIPVNTTYPTSTTSPNAEQVSVNLTCVAAGFANVRIGFHYVGAWDWFWAIDDVILQDAPANDVSVGTVSYYSTTIPAAFGNYPRYTIFPANEVKGMGFAADIQNRGSDPQTNAALNINVFNPSSTSVFTGAGAGAALGVCSGTLIQDSVMTYTAAGTLGTHKIAYNANYANIGLDADMSNNTDTLTFTIDNRYYGRDDNTFRTGGMWNGSGNGYVIGPAFQMSSNQTLYGISAAFSGSTNAGVVACAQLYEIDQSTGDFVLIDETCGTSRELTITSSMISTGGNIVWTNHVFTNPITLTAGSEYLAAIQHYGGPANLVIMSGGPAAAAQTVFLLDATDNTWYYTTTHPKIRMNFDQSIGVNEIESNGLEVSQNIPNPANGNTVINFSMANGAEVTFELIDLTGKVVMTQNRGNKAAGSHSITVDGSNLAAGVYYYTVNAGGVKVTKKMIITE